MLFIDIGAHVGNYSEAYSRCPGVTKVYAFEPSPYNQKILHDRFDTNPIIEIVPCAVGATSGTIKLFRYTGDADGAPSNTGRSSIFSNNLNVSKDIFYEVPMIRLSDFMKQNKITHVDCLKIDVEGAEYDIIEDLLDSMLINHIRQIIVSEHRFLFDATFNNRAEEIMQRFHREYKGIIQKED